MKYTVAQLAKEKGFSEKALLSFGLRDGVREGKACAEIPYYKSDGTEYERVRLRFDGGKDGHRWNSGDAPCIPYGLHRPIPYDKGFAWIVEGESDCWALWQANHPALGIPGSTNTGCLRLGHVGGAKQLFIVQEPGPAGEAFPRRVASRLYEAGYEGTIFAIVLQAKDPRELMLKDAEKFETRLREALVKGRKKIERPKAPVREDFSVMTMSEYLCSRGSVTHWLVEGLITLGGSMLVGAKKKVGKSILALNLARCVARGEAFLGRRVKQGGVLYVSLDEPKQITDHRTEVLGFREDDPILMYASRRIPADWGGWIAHLAQAHQPALVIVDTFAKLADIKEINNYAEWNKAYAILFSALEATKSAVVLLAHNKKEGQGFDAVIGSTAVTGNVDTIMVITKDADNIRTVETEQRHGQDMEPSVLKLDEDTYELNVFDKRLHMKRDCEQAVLNVLSNEPMTAKQVAATTKKRAYNVRNALHALIDAGLVMGQGSGRKDDERMFRLSMMRSVETISGILDESGKSGPSRVSQVSSLSDVSGLSRESGLSPLVPDVPDNEEDAMDRELEQLFA